MGADLVGVRIAHRPRSGDVYARLDVASMPAIEGTGIAGNPGLVYGLRFLAGSRAYEVRAMRLGGITRIALFDCEETCRAVPSLRGGYGTIGPAVVATIPLRAVGLARHGRIRPLEAFTSAGTNEVVLATSLDRVPLSP